MESRWRALQAGEPTRSSRACGSLGVGVREVLLSLTARGEAGSLPPPPPTPRTAPPRPLSSWPMDCLGPGVPPGVTDPHLSTEILGSESGWREVQALQAPSPAHTEGSLPGPAVTCCLQGCPPEAVSTGAVSGAYTA